MTKKLTGAGRKKFPGFVQIFWIHLLLVLLGLGALSLLVTPISPAFAHGGVSLYISNRLFSHPVIQVKDDFQAPLEPLLTSLNLLYVKKGNVWCATTPDFVGGPCPSETGAAVLYINQVPLVQGVFVRDGKPWLSIKALALRLKYKLIYNRETGLLDLYRAASGTAVYGGKEAAGGAGKGEVKAGEGAEKVKIVSVEDPDRNSAAMMRTISVTVENQGDEKVEDVKVKVDLLDGTGAITGIRKENLISSMDPGEKRTVRFEWNKNYEMGTYARFEGYDPAGKLRYDTPVSVTEPKVTVEVGKVIKKEKKAEEKEVKKAY